MLPRDVTVIDAPIKDQLEFNMFTNTDILKNSLQGAFDE